MSEYISINDAYPVTRYTTESYSAADDNKPFTDLEDRANWFSSLYNQLGFYYIGNSTTLSALTNYSLVTINVSGIISELSGVSTTLPASSLIGIVYTLNEQTLPLYTATGPTTYYYPVVMASDFLSIPILTTYFEDTTWNEPAAGSRNYDSYMVGDYIYYDKGTYTMAAFPVTVTVTSTTYLGDDEGKKIRLGKIVAKTNTNYVIKFNSTEMYGSGITFANKHEDLLDIASQDVTACGTWVDSHSGYRPTILRTSVITAATSGDLIGQYEGTYEPYNSRGIVVGILAYSDVLYSYIMVSGVWDITVRETTPTGLTIDNTDIGRTIWASETSGNVTVTPPTDITKAIVPVGRVVSTNQIFIAPANGFNSYIEMLSDLTNNQASPDAMTSALELQQDFSGIEVTSIAGTGDPIKNMKLRKINSDCPVHITPLTQTISGTNLTNHWFALTENSWMNDVYVDYLWTGNSTSKTNSNTYLGNDLQPYSYILQYNYDPYVPGINGSYRLGWHSWKDAQSLDLSGITYDSTAKTITLEASGADNIYIWHSAKMLTEMGWANSIPWAGLFMMVHDVSTETKMCLFSYEGYSGFDTDTFTFNNVNIYTKTSSGNMISNPTWTYAATGQWQTLDTTGWMFASFPMGGIRLKISGNGTFNKISNVPPYSLKWSNLKKGGISVLGAVDTSTASGQLAWDTTNDLTGLFTGLSTKTDLETTYAGIDYTSGGTTAITLATHPTVIHKASYHPYCINQSITATAGVSNPLVYTAGWTDLVYTPEYIDTTYGPTREWGYYALTTNEPASPILAVSGFPHPQTMNTTLQTNGVMVKLVLSGDPTIYYGITSSITTSGATGTAGILMPLSYGITGTHTVTGYELYTINDDIVNKASYIMDDDGQELWVDVSKKSTYRAYSVMFEIVDVKPSSMLEIMPAQSHFNNMKNSLKSIVLGCAMYSKMTETDKIVTYIQNRASAPSTNT
jgi:hypothetical protein